MILAPQPSSQTAKERQTAAEPRDIVLKNAQHFGANVKQAKTATHVKLEEVLLTWFREVTAAGVNVDGKVIREKADNIALSLGIEDFQASGGWLHRFKERHGLVYKVVSGEAKKVDESQVSDWLNTLPALISDYAPRNVFNADEAGLFFNLQPERSLCMKGQACHGSQKSKERVTVLFCTNADGSEKIQLTVIGKSKQPRCFRSAGRLPCLYKGNKKAWMTADFFREFLTTLDRKMGAKNRKILLFVDQCSAHPKDCNFTNVTVRFLPANTTSRLQSLDAGIIRNVKHHFKGLLVRRLLAKIERKEENLKISLLNALHFLAMSWDNVTQDTIANCFRKCGFFAGQGAALMEEDEEPDADLHIEGWEDLGTQASAQDFVTADDNVATCGL
ncbi:tigger transposable element-derived protein 6-like [Rhipicephalus sanguineus]|uniref:tigger transposable element-derived protein 6-like n=1 Tax=Rhipicephalus sanguineus TaxID=34632 RepID=UPI0020C3B38C|nr:tigger transposable element-derived protein 6-like [Rhipicephalus sanguineus]